MRINEWDAVAFGQQERVARGLPGVDREPWLQGHWDTFADMAPLGSLLVELCDRTARAFADAGQPIPPSSVTFSRDGTIREVRWSRQAVDKVVAWWVGGELSSVTVDFQTADMERQAEVSVELADQTGGASRFDVIVWKTESIAAVAEQVVDVVTFGALATDAAYGAVTYDYGDSRRLPFELWYGIHDGWTRADRFSRGYYWANVLSHRHLQALGGVEVAAVRATDAGMRFMLLRETPGRDLAVIRMACRIDEISDDDLAAMKQLLSPTWLPVRYRCYQGPPLRILKDPGDAYIVPPVGAKLPNWGWSGEPLPDEEPEFDMDTRIRELSRDPNWWKDEPGTWDDVIAGDQP